MNPHHFHPHLKNTDRGAQLADDCLRCGRLRHLHPRGMRGFKRPKRRKRPPAQDDE